MSCEYVMPQHQCVPHCFTSCTPALHHRLSCDMACGRARVAAANHSHLGTTDHLLGLLHAVSSGCEDVVPWCEDWTMDGAEACASGWPDGPASLSIGNTWCPLSCGTCRTPGGRSVPLPNTVIAGDCSGILNVCLPSFELQSFSTAPQVARSTVGTGTLTVSCGQGAAMRCMRTRASANTGAGTPARRVTIVRRLACEDLIMAACCQRCWTMLGSAPDAVLNTC